MSALRYDDAYDRLHSEIARQTQQLGLPPHKVEACTMVRCEDWDGADKRVAFDVVVLFAVEGEALAADASILHVSGRTAVVIVTQDGLDAALYYRVQKAALESSASEAPTVALHSQAHAV